MAQAGQLETADAVERQVRDVHAEHGARRHVQALVRLHQPAGDVRGGRQVVRQTRDQREGECRTAAEAAFDGRRDRTGIEHVVAEVGAEVDARHHHVRRVLEQAVEAQVHAIGGRAVQADEAVGHGDRVQGPVQGQGTAGPAHVLDRCDDPALGVIRQRGVQRGEPGRIHPVVVGNQNTHQMSVCPARLTSSRTTAVAKHPVGRTNSSCRMSGAG